MTKSVKWSLIFIIFFMVMTTVSFATDIDMNLGGNTATNQTTINEIATNTETDGTTNTSSLNTQTNNSTTVTSVSSEEESTLSINTILNILLIVVGVVLILLGIAILIRLKS